MSRRLPNRRSPNASFGLPKSFEASIWKLKGPALTGPFCQLFLLLAFE